MGDGWLHVESTQQTESYGQMGNYATMQHNMKSHISGLAELAL